MASGPQYRSAEYSLRSIAGSQDPKPGPIKEVVAVNLVVAVRTTGLGNQSSQLGPS